VVGRGPIRSQGSFTKELLKRKKPGESENTVASSVGKKKVQSPKKRERVPKKTSGECSRKRAKSKKRARNQICVSTRNGDKRSIEEERRETSEGHKGGGESEELEWLSIKETARKLSGVNR